MRANIAPWVFGAFAACLVGAASAQLEKEKAGSRTVLGVNEYLSAGADAIRAGQYDDGIRLTELGIERSTLTKGDRSAALSNLCAAHAAKHELEQAIDYCTESLILNDRNWRAFSNRSYAYYLKGQYRKANADLRAAAAINPEARQVARIRGMVNERNLQPSVIVEEHQ
jgi:tetratricopeptide (TPR) repeat protein